MDALIGLVFLLVCPLMMVVMMRGMHGGSHPTAVTRSTGDDPRVTQLEHEVAQLREQVTSQAHVRS